MKKTAWMIFAFICICGLIMCMFVSCTKDQPKREDDIPKPNNTSDSVFVKVYIDGSEIKVISTDISHGYTITPPEKPEDITTNPNSKKYFYGWFIDPDFQNPLSESTKFRNGGAIYGKLISVDPANFKYEVDFGKATITGYKGTVPTVLVIPPFIDPFPVEGIRKDAFSNNRQIVKVIFFNGIESITGFNGCDGIKDIYIPESVKSIGEYAFNECYNLRSVIFEENSQCKTIGAYAFRSTHLTHIKIPSAVQCIEEDAFSRCSYLQEITFEELSQCNSIGSSAFWGCEALRGIAIPDSVKDIGNRAFGNCSSLRYNTYMNASYIGNSNNPYIYLVKCNTADLSSCVISSQTKFIGNSAFEGRIGERIEIPDSVISIQYAAFKNCRTLKNINIPSSVIRIEEAAFAGCTAIGGIRIPSSVKYMGMMVFQDWKSTQTICFEVGEMQNGWSGYWKAGCWAKIYWNS